MNVTLRTPLLVDLWRREFRGYSRDRFVRDLVAGLTVAAVALPLALAFGVASGSTAAAGLVTAIIAGLAIGALSGAPYQISGPTGAMSAAMIKAVRGGSKSELRPVFERGLNHIMTRQHRLADGTLARNRPQRNTLWLDDLFMSVPAIAQMGKLTGDNKYYDDAAKQVLSFADKMFNREKGVFMHGWVESMPTHPEFRWARANGSAGTRSASVPSSRQANV